MEWRDPTPRQRLLPTGALGGPEKGSVGRRGKTCVSQGRFVASHRAVPRRKGGKEDKRRALFQRKPAQEGELTAGKAQLPCLRGGLGYS